MGSYLDARHHGGQWLVRIEDLDRPRVVPGSADRILHTLESFGLHWDGAVEYQSARTAQYVAAAEHLRASGLTFECSCSRRELAGAEVEGYPGTCRAGPARAGPTATRFRVPDQELIVIDDRVQGECRLDLAALGDCIIRRKDGIFSYQLAVVVDDAAQAVTHIVRGADLLPSTGWQIALQRALRLSQPRYAHLPLVLAAAHEKLAKSRQSIAVSGARAGATIAQVLRMLGHTPPGELERGTPRRLLEWARDSWNPQLFHGVRTVMAPTAVRK